MMRHKTISLMIQFVAIFYYCSSALASPAGIDLDLSLNPVRAVVVPFVNDTGDASLDWLSFGLHNVVTTDMGYIGKFDKLKFSSFVALYVKDLLKPANLRALTREEILEKARKEEFLRQVWVGRFHGNRNDLDVEITVLDVRTGSIMASARYHVPLEQLMQETSSAVVRLARDLGLPAAPEEEKRITSVKTAVVRAWQLDAEAYVLLNQIDREKNTFEEEDAKLIERLGSEAGAKLLEAVSLDQNYSEAWCYLGAFHYQQGRPDQARSSFQRALDLKPYLIDAWLGLAYLVIASESGKPDMSSIAKSVGYLQRAYEINPAQPDIYELVLIATSFAGEKEAVEALLRKFSRSAWPLLRTKAVMFLGAFESLIGRAAMMQVCVELLDDPDPEVRRTAIYAVGQAGDRTSVRLLLRFLKDPDARTRDTTASALGDIGDESAAAELMPLMSDPDMKVRSSAFSALERIGGKSVVPAMLEALKSEDIRMRISALMVLQKAGDSSVVPVLTELLKDRDKRIRGTAAKALGNIGDASVTLLLAEMLKDPEKTVRESAAWALYAMKDSRSVPALIVALKDPEASVREDAAYALGEIGDKTAVPALLEALASDKEKRYAYVTALMKIGDKSAVPALVGVLKDESWSVRLEAVRALVSLGDRSAVPALIETLKDTKDSVRGEAARALGRLGDKAAVPALTALLKDAEIHARFDAALALAMLGDRSGIALLQDALDGNIFGWERGNRAVEVLAEIGEAEKIYDYFKSILFFDYFVFNFLRSRLLFPANPEMFAVSPDQMLKAHGYYLNALKEREAGKYGEQRTMAEKALGLIVPSERPGLAILCLWLKAQAEIKLEKPLDALASLQVADTLLASLSKTERERYDEYFREFTLFLFGEAYAAAGKNKDAAKSYEASLDMLAKTRKEIYGPAMKEKAAKLEVMIRTSLGAVQVKQGKENLEKAVEGGRNYQANDSVEMENEEKRYVELSRQKIAEGSYEEAQRLIEELALRRTQYVNRRVKLNLADAGRQRTVEEYRRKQEEIESITRKMEEAARKGEGGKKTEQAQEALRGLEEEKNRKKRELQVYLTNLKKTQPDMAALMGAKPMELTAIQEQLPADVAVVQYLMLSDKLAAFVIRAGGIEISEIAAKKAEIREKVEALRRGINAKAQGKESKAIGPLSAELNDILIKPLEEGGKLKGVKVLGISPNGFLHQLPFGVLADKGGKSLIDRYEVFYVNSTSLLGVAMERGKGKGEGEGLLAVSNPDGSLPAADEEVKGISKLFAKKQTYSQKEAKRESIQKMGKGYSVLHFSTHGVFDPLDSTKSYLVMADGRLSIEDIWGLPLGGVRLTALSACETGLGEVMSGDDVVSLENAFIYAGSPSVVATLWKVADEPTSELMQGFYENMLKGKTKAEALTEAQRKVREKYPNPFFWAAFTLRGDWR